MFVDWLNKRLYNHGLVEECLVLGSFKVALLSITVGEQSQQNSHCYFLISKQRFVSHSGFYKTILS